MIKNNIIINNNRFFILSNGLVSRFLGAGQSLLDRS